MFVGRLSGFFSSLFRTNRFLVVVEFASRITGQEKIIYLSSANDRHGSYCMYHLFAFIFKKDSRISSPFISLFLREQNIKVSYSLSYT